MVTKTKHKLLLILLLCLFVFSGCIEIKDLKVGTNIGLDGSGSRIISFALDKKVVALAEKESGEKLENHFKRELPSGTKIKTSQKNGTVSYVITMKFKDVNDIPYPLRKVLKGNKDTDISLIKKDNIFAISYDLKEELNVKKDLADDIMPKSLNVSINTPEIEYWVQLPGEIRETSGTPVTLNRSVWKLRGGKTYKIRVKSLLIKWWLVAFSGIGLLLLIGVLGALVINHKTADSDLSST